jgi:hypothetical protein
MHLWQPVLFVDVGVGMGVGMGVAMVVVDPVVAVVVRRGGRGGVDGGGVLATLMMWPHTLSYIAVVMVPKPISGGYLQDLLV